MARDKNKVSQAQGGKEQEEERERRSRQVFAHLPALGPVLFLYMQYAHRRHHFIGDLEWMLMPPLVNGQCRLYTRGQAPVGFVSWAFLDRPAEQRLLASGGRLRPGDWNSGDRVWLIDLLAPFGGMESIVRDLKTTIFPGRTLRAAVYDPRQGRLEVRELARAEDSGTAGEAD